MTPSATPVRRFALLIGVNHYSNPTLQGADLLGSVNEVKAWFAFLRRLGVAPRDIQVLTSPILTLEELGCDEADGVVPALADTKHVNDAVTTLHEALAATGEAGVGFFAFFGHGEAVSPANTVFLEDYDGQEMTTEPAEGNVAVDGRISTFLLEKTLANPEPDASGSPTVTCVWDTCRRSHWPTAQVPVPLRSPQVVQLRSSQPGQQSFERCFAGVWRTQFSWAALTVLEQWPLRMSNGTRYVAIDVTTLNAKSTALVSVFDRASEPASATHPPSTDQTPGASAGRSGAPFLMPLTDTSPVSPVAKAGPSEEFPSGTTDFWTGTEAAPGPLFLRIVRVNNALTYYIRSDYQVAGDAGNVSWPPAYYMKVVSTGALQKPPNPQTQPSPPAPPITFIGYPYTSSPPDTDLSGSFGAPWASAGQWIQMAPDAANDRVLWRHYVNNVTGGYTTLGEDSFFGTTTDPDGTNVQVHNDGEMNNTRGNSAPVVPNPPSQGLVWKYWVDERS